MIGRPPRYTDELAERILQELARGRTQLDICAEPGMPCEKTVRQWVEDDIGGFAARYRKAREIGDPLSPYQAPYTAGIAERVLGEVSNGRRLAEVCNEPGMPCLNTVRNWVAENREGFAARYRQAHEIGRTLRDGYVAYSAEIADRILGGLMEGRTLIGVCNDPGMPAAATVLLWVRHDREGFKARYHEARDIGNRLLADEIIEIGRDASKDRIKRRGKDGEIEEVVDHDHISRARLHSDNLKWTLSRVLPRTYGDRLDVNATHHAGNGWAELLKAVNNKSRGLPNQYPLPQDDGDGNA